MEDEDDAGEIAGSVGYFTSGLSPVYYETYERTHIIETLSDWGYYGPAALRRPTS